jgi:hypothetical protein
MSDGISIGKGRATAQTKDAIRVSLQSGIELWIPQSVIHDDSEVFERGGTGNVVVAEWWADVKGLSDSRQKMGNR